MRNLLIVFISLVMLAYSDTASQTDWSGGPGTIGPVQNWENYFFSSGANVHYNSGDPILYNSSPPVMHQISMNCNGARAVHASDLDGDGDMDVLASATADDQILWWENTDCSGRNWLEHIVSTDVLNAVSLTAEDIDGDGDNDILAASDLDCFIVWYENIDGTGVNWDTHLVADSFYQAYSAHAGDFDGDGDLDVLGGSREEGVYWWENVNGLGMTWVLHEVNSAFEEARSVYSVDVNGDGYLDAVACSYDNDVVVWWENEFGYGLFWEEHLIDSYFNGAYSVYSDDVDLDGDMDILGAAYHANEITWWENSNELGTAWVKHSVEDEFSGANCVHSGDFDCDGDVDLLGSNVHYDEVSWWENIDNSGTEWVEHPIANNLNSASSVFGGDLDGDGDTDILATGRIADDVIWWEVSPKGGLISSVLDAGEVAQWNTFISSTDEPEGTSISFQFRSSSDPDNMGEWSDTLYGSSTSLSGILADSTRYLQYKAILERIDRAITPVLEDVSFSYSVLLQVDDDEQYKFSVLPVKNPSRGNVSLRITVPLPQAADLSLYDLAGRLVARYNDNLDVGTNDIAFVNIAPGTYLYELKSENFCISNKVVVVR